MKTVKLRRILLLLTLFSRFVYAEAGDFGPGNGGDLCENRIKSIRADIESWILREGSKGLKLHHGTLQEDYDKTMLKELKAHYPISCTQERVFIGHSEKTCKNYKGPDGVKRISCNLTRFSNLSEEDQYKLVHHEYAGLAGLEVNTGEESNYFYSNQLSSHLENQIVKKLVIKTSQNDTIQNDIILDDTLFIEMMNSKDLSNCKVFTSDLPEGRLWKKEEIMSFLSREEYELPPLRFDQKKAIARRTTQGETRFEGFGEYFDILNIKQTFDLLLNDNLDDITGIKFNHTGDVYDVVNNGNLVSPKIEIVFVSTIKIYGSCTF